MSNCPPFNNHYTNNKPILWCHITHTNKNMYYFAMNMFSHVNLKFPLDED